MGWSRGFENGREVGYAVEAECDADGCSTEIDRGMAYRCGADCGAFVCYPHNYVESCECCDPHVVAMEHPPQPSDLNPFPRLRLWRWKK